MRESKEQRYRRLVERVRASYPPNCGEPEPGKLYRYPPCDEINLWTYWQGRGNLNAELLLVGQDWGNPWTMCPEGFADRLKKAGEGPLPDYMKGNDNRTDRNLEKLFKELEPALDLEKPCRNVFFTNFVLGYRAGKISGGFKNSWAQKDSQFFGELVDILEPKVILCLGKSVFEAVMKALAPNSRPRIKSYNAFIESPENPCAAVLTSGKRVTIFALAHCGAYGTMNRNRGSQAEGLELQRKDWRRISPYLHSSDRREPFISEPL